jgi:hypothetical protein
VANGKPRLRTAVLQFLWRLWIEQDGVFLRKTPLGGFGSALHQLENRIRCTLSLVEHELYRSLASRSARWPRRSHSYHPAGTARARLHLWGSSANI